MSVNSEELWQAVGKLEENHGQVAVLAFVLCLLGVVTSIMFLAAWAVSVALGTGYWITFLSLVLLRIAFSIF